MQAKLEMGEAAALLEDFDRVLRQQRPAWVEEWDGGDYKVGTLEYFACKRAAVKAFQENCLGFHAEAFETWIGEKYGQTDSAHGDMVVRPGIMCSIVRPTIKTTSTLTAC